MGRNRRPRRVAASLIAASLLALITVSGTGAARGEHWSSGCHAGHRIALTFDDGPNPRFTDQILTILESRRVRATFFDEGEAAKNSPSLVQDEALLGMAVGSHSYAHSTGLPTMPRAAFAADVQRAEAVLAPLVGHRPALYRSPYGHTSDSMLTALRDAGYASIGWDLDSGDWRGDASADDIVSNVLRRAHPGAIVLLHDGGLGGGNPDRSATVAALPRIIDGLRARGYAFVTVPELTGQPDAHGGERRPACSAT